MRSARSEHILLAALLAVPVVVAFIVWPALVRWAVGPSPESAPEVAGASATSAAGASAPTPRPTVGAPPTIASHSTAVPTVAIAPTQSAIAATRANAPNSASAPVSAPTPAVRAADPSAAVHATDPSAAVQDFYARVAAHDFQDAAALWSPRMRATFPPAQNIDQRFSRTRAVTVRRADVVSQNGDRAAVAVDLDEAAADGQHHWSGTWYEVRGPDGWLLDQPQLEGT